MSEIKSYRDLVVWQRSKDLAVMIYKTTERFPSSEQYGLTSQIRRAAVAIPSNIAEGYGRKSKTDYARFLQISRGSLFELETQLTIAKELSLLKPSLSTEIESTCLDIAKMLNALIAKLNNPNP